VLSYDEIKKLISDSRPDITPDQLAVEANRVWEGALSAYVYRVNHPDPDIRNDKSPIVVAPGEPAQAPVAQEPAQVPAQSPDASVSVSTGVTVSGGAPVATVPINQGAQVNEGAPVNQGAPPAAPQGSIGV